MRWSGESFYLGGGQDGVGLYPRDGVGWGRGRSGHRPGPCGEGGEPYHMTQ